jgi:hypothetical protein
VRGDAFLGHPVHLHGPDLHFEGQAVFADHRGVQGLIAVGPRHRDEVLDAPRHRRPGLVDDAERGVAVLDAVGHDAERDEIVDLLELDLLALQLLRDAPQSLDAPVDLGDRHLRLGQLGGHRLLQLLDQAFRLAALRVDFRPQRLVRLRLQVAERPLLELVLDLAHAEPVGDRRVDIAGFLCDLHPLVVGQVAQGAHVVQAIGQFDQDHPDVVDHRQEHLAEVLRLALLARRERHRADFRHPLDDMGDLGTEQLPDPLDGRQGVLDDVVEEAGGDGDGVQLHVGEEIGHRQGVDQVRLPRMADLPPVLEGGEDVGSPEQFDVGVGAVGPDFFQKIFEANHADRCLSQ